MTAAELMFESRSTVVTTVVGLLETGVNGFKNVYMFCTGNSPVDNYYCTFY